MRFCPKQACSGAGHRVCFASDADVTGRLRRGPLCIPKKKSNHIASGMHPKAYALRVISVRPLLATSGYFQFPRSRRYVTHRASRRLPAALNTQSPHT